MSLPNCTCGASWTGARSEHCPACHRTFSGSSTGDAHRYGKHPHGRKCLTTDEMREKGWRPVPCATGEPIWRGPENPLWSDPEGTR